MEDKEVQDFFTFLKVANDTITERGRIYEFKCPVCGEKAKGIKNDYNGHLFAECKKCDLKIME